MAPSAAERTVRSWPLAAAFLSGVVAVCSLLGCGGGGDLRPASAGPVVGSPAPAARPHCPDRVGPVPAGLDFSNRIISDRGSLPLLLNGANFDHATLDGLVLSGQFLDHATFRGAVIKGVDFTQANLKGANFEGATFVIKDTSGDRQISQTALAAYLPNACLIGATFTDADGFSTVDVLDGNTSIDMKIDGADFSYSDIFSVADFLTVVSAASRTPVAKRVLFRGLKIPCAYLHSIDAIDLTDTDISGCSTGLNGTNLSGRNFDGMDLSGVNFAGSDLTNASFRNVTFGGASPESFFNPFDGAGSMDGAVFTGATFNFMSFAHVSLQGANFDGASFFLATFTDVQLQRATFRRARGVVDFETVALAAAHFDSAALNIHFRDSTFSPDTDFTGASLTLDGRPNFSGTDLSGVTFDGVTFVKANFSGATLTGASFQGATLDGSTGLNGTALAPARLSGVKFNKASAVGVDFSYAQLYGADFTYADLTNTSFSGSFLTSNIAINQLAAAQFDGARLRNANFTNAKLQGVSFASANLYSQNGSLDPYPTCQVNVATCPSASPRTGYTCSCASMAGADLTSTKFTGAYLAGVDFANSATTVNGTIFDGAILVGANFDGVDFRAASGSVPSFKGAMLQGANLGATGTGLTLTLTGAFLDFKDNGSGGSGVQFWLGSDHTKFRNWKGPARACVEALYLNPSVMPTQATLDCPDGTKGQCGAVLPGPNSTSHWWNRTPLATATPVPGWYDLDASYESAPDDTSVVCGGNDLTEGW